MWPWCNDQVLLNISFYDLDLDEAHESKKVAISDDIVIYTHIFYVDLILT